MKQLCLDCFMKGRVKVLVNGQCQDCGCRQSVIYASATMSKPRHLVWPHNADGPVCPDHRDNKYFQ